MRGHFLLVGFIMIVSLASTATAGLINTNPGFENGLNGWATYKGPGLENSAIIEVEPQEPGFTVGQQHLFMRLPANATVNQSQYVNVGQTLNLRSDKRYLYTIKVKWANPENPLPSAILSIWAYNQDGTYSGRDEWISDSNSHTLQFEFTPTATGPVFCYVALLTHQNGFFDTDILVDRFRIEEIGDATVDEDPRPANDNLLSNSAFNSMTHWNDTTWNPHGVSGLNNQVVTENGNNKLRLDLPYSANTTYLNNTWTGVYQEITLYAGNTYELSCNVDRIVPSGTPHDSIVNIYAYKPDPPEAWLGSIDYKFNRAENHLYSERITPTETTTYHITARVFGWGNDGNPLSVYFDNVKLKRVP